MQSCRHWSLGQQKQAVLGPVERKTIHSGEHLPATRRIHLADHCPYACPVVSTRIILDVMKRRLAEKQNNIDVLWAYKVAEQAKVSLGFLGDGMLASRSFKSKGRYPPGWNTRVYIDP